MVLNNSTQQRSSRKVQTYLNSQNARAWKVLLLNFIRYRLFLQLLGRERELKGWISDMRYDIFNRRIFSLLGALFLIYVTEATKSTASIGKLIDRLWIILNRGRQKLKTEEDMKI